MLPPHPQGVAAVETIAAALETEDAPHALELFRRYLDIEIGSHS